MADDTRPILMLAVEDPQHLSDVIYWAECAIALGFQSERTTVSLGHGTMLSARDYLTQMPSHDDDDPDGG